MRKKTAARLKRYSFTINVAGALLLLFGILAWATFDIYNAIRHNDEQLQAADLRSQLVEFLLATTREPDGSSLLDNPDDYALARRPLRIATAPKPFFSYFLTTGNWRTFRKDLVRTEHPRACVLEYPVDLDSAGQHSPNTLQACFAAVQNDPAGRYVYAVLRYPTPGVVSHRRGRPLTEGDHVRLRFQSADGEVTALQLVLETPNLPAAARRRNAAHFDGLYELAGFLNSDVGHPTPWVSGHAVERDESPEGARHVTIAMRIDAALFGRRFDKWPDAFVKGLSIGMEIDRRNGSSISIADTQKGSALSSLAQAYLSSVRSGATLDIHYGSDSGELFWSSRMLEPPGLEAGPGVLQRIGNQLSDLLKGKTLQVKQAFQSSGAGTLTAQLNSSGKAISDSAARALGLLSLAAMIVLYLTLLGFYVANTIGRITADAMTTARKHIDSAVWRKYWRRHDQVGIIGRVIYILVRRIRDGVERRAKTLDLAEAATQQLRQNLHLISHEIRSPVASLLVKDGLDEEAQRFVARIQRAMDLLKVKGEVDATTGKARVSTCDLASSLAAFVHGLSDQGLLIEYVGPNSGVQARYDEILLDQVLDALLDNAFRYAVSGTPAIIRLSVHDTNEVGFEVFNQGPRIDDVETIFQLGETTQDNPSNQGMGLYAARQYVKSFGGSIRAENVDNGVAFTVMVPAG